MRRLACILAVSVAGCAAGTPRVDTARMGAVYMDRGAGCSIAFENLTMQEAMTRGDHIGMITMQGTDALDETAKALVEREACKVGADFVTFNAGMGELMQFLAWKARAPDASPPAASPPAKEAP